MTSDHGFSTHTLDENPKATIKDFAAEHGLEEGDIIVTGQTIYLSDTAKSLLVPLVEHLQQTDWVGPIFTAALKPGSIQGQVAGTLSLDVVRGGHPDRAPDIIVSPAWTNDKTGPFMGTVLTGGVAGHGSLSPWDVHNTLIARGPDFEGRTLIGTPSHNTDLAPTVCHLLGVDVPATMAGRILFEGLRASDPNPPEAVTHATLRTTRSFDNGMNFAMEVSQSYYRGRTYLNYGRANHPN